MQISYRPEIDGLRAIAVVTVILYHAQVAFFGLQLFQGGGIGVDIFFVISGYLITLIILKELSATDTFSFKGFYKRRVRRILPALFVVMLVSLPFAWVYLFPSSLISFSKSIISSLGFASNFYFHSSGQQYGAEDSLVVPFLHTWSLSVEEQFYILFPPALLVTFRYFRKYLGVLLICSFFISLLLAEWGSRNYPVFNFYVLPTRGWELLAGSILAYYEIQLGHRSKNKILNFIFPGIGLFLIGYSVLFFNDEVVLHPSFHTLIPIIGVCLVIWFSQRHEIITKMLSSRLLVGIGLISYSLYLWHYPIFAFYRIANPGEELSYAVGFGLVLISTVSYFFIEKPARNRNNKFKLLLSLGGLFLLIILVFNLLVIKNSGFKTRSHFPVIINNTFSSLNYREINQNGIGCHDRLGDQGFCIFNELEDNSGDIILLGDSLTDALLKNFIEKVSKTKLRLIHMSYSGNLYLPNTVRVRKNNLNVLSDEKIHQYRKDFIENNSSENTYIIIFGDYNFYFEKSLKFDKNEEVVEYETSSFFIERNKFELNYRERKLNLENKFKETLNQLSKNKKVILVYPTPVAPVHILDRIRVNFDEGRFQKDKYYLEDKANYDKDLFRKYNSNIFNLLDSINNDNIHKVNPERVFCPLEKCIFYDNNYSYIFDTVHASYEGSKLINDLIFKEIEKIERDPSNIND
ncbi:acyltransferase [Gammaproteobacteria bacterium]|nr:acyltransferase [Gammaproteobacteria bacterium]